MQHATFTRALVAMGILAIVPCAQAQSGLLPSNIGPPISNHTLARQQGRGVLSNGQVVAFGVAMNSQWQNAAGGDVHAHLNIVLHQSGTVSMNGPVVNTTTRFTGAKASTSKVIGRPPTRRLSSGVGQSIQVAGSSNRAQNRLHLHITSHQLAGVASNGFNGSSTGCGTSCTVNAARGSNGVRLTVHTPYGQQIQSINPGQITQSIQAAGQASTVLNTLDLTARISQLQHSSGIQSTQIEQQLSMLRSIQ